MQRKMSGLGRNMPHSLGDGLKIVETTIASGLLTIHSGEAVPARL
jgi:hypothetical protein